MVSCQKNINQKNTEEIVDKYNIPSRENIIIEYDVDAFIYFFTEKINDDGRIFELLPEALYIAENTNDPVFYKFIYLCTLNKYSSFNEIYNDHIICFNALPSKDKLFVLRYLEKGALQNDEICINYLNDIKNRNNKP